MKPQELVPRINGERLWADLMALGEIGFEPGRGVTRTALSDEDLLGRAWLVGRFQEAGLEVRTDAAGNVIGRLRSGSSGTGLVAVGSRLDTVPQGGRFDGMLGVLAGLECVRTLREHGIALPWDLEVIDFTDEEAAHSAGTVGSRAMMGDLALGELEKSIRQGRPSFSEDLRKAGKDPARIGEARRNPAEFSAYLESSTSSREHADPATWRVSDAYRPIGRLYGDSYCTTRQRFDLPGPLPE